MTAEGEASGLEGIEKKIKKILEAPNLRVAQNVTIMLASHERGSRIKIEDCVECLVCLCPRTRSASGTQQALGTPQQTLNF